MQKRKAKKRQKSPPAADESPRTFPIPPSWLLTALVVGLGIWAIKAFNGQVAGPTEGANRQGEGNGLYSYEVVNTFPHDSDAYTQGLVFEDGYLFEGTGRYGKSTLRKVELKSGRVVKRDALGRKLFGEGIDVWGDHIVQLTWKAGLGLIYDKQTFRKVGQFRYAGQGWGLTHNGKHFIMSDGTSTLRFLDPKTFRVVRTLKVTDGQRPIEMLNELEFIEGEIFANIWPMEGWNAYTNYIARISPETGKVVGWIDLSGLLKPEEQGDPDHVLNGIAYDTKEKRLFVTGKNWPKLFEIKVVPKVAD